MDVLIDAPEMNKVYHTDALTLLAALSDKSVDAYITDLPYATTALSWDEIIPFAPMWAEVKRTLKPRGVFVTTASQPFTSKLVMSNINAFKYTWIWVKNISTNFGNAHYQPMRSYEDICVFYATHYYPQGITRANIKAKGFKAGGRTTRTFGKPGTIYTQEFTGYPNNVLYFDAHTTPDHPTQKPVDLYEYLIRTYTQAGELVVDFCCGSGTTGRAAQVNGRNFIMCDITPEYVDIARKRLAQPFTPLMPMFI